jgi:hypothetical protein
MEERPPEMVTANILNKQPRTNELEFRARFIKDAPHKNIVLF